MLPARSVAPLLLSVSLAACSSDETGAAPPPVPTEVATLGGAIGEMALSGSDLICAVDKAGIVRVATATGQTTPYLAGERVRRLVADAGHVAWVFVGTGVGAHELVKVAPADDGSKPITLADSTREIAALALDDAFVYWTVETDVYPKSLYDLFRAPVAGGAAVAVATGVESVSALGLDATNLFFVSGDALVSMPKAGGPLTKVLVNPTGLGGAGQVLVDDKNVTYLGATGGGATGNFVAWVPKDGAPAKQTYAFPCQRVAALAADGESIFATCNADIQEFKKTPALTIRKVPEGGTAITTIGQQPNTNASSDTLGSVVVDASRAYVAFGSKVLAVAK